MAEWGGRMVAEFWKLVVAEYGTRCHLCGGEGADTIDHVIARAAGGDPYALDNMRPAHGGCNSARQDMPLTKWFALHPLPKDRAPWSLPWTSPPERVISHTERPATT